MTSGKDGGLLGEPLKGADKTVNRPRGRIRNSVCEVGLVTASV